MTTILLRFAFEHLAVVATWVLMAVVCAGVGLLYRRLYTRGPASGDDLLLAIWTGFACTLVILVLWHFLLRIDGRLTSMVAALGIVGVVVCHADWRPALARWRLRDNALGIGLAVLFVCWVANRGLGPLEYYDSGMYHLATVDWTNAYPIVPGLGNLHGRLAFNATSLLYAALLDVGPWNGTSFHIANGFLMALLGAPLMLAVSRLLMGRMGARPSHDVFAALLVFPLVGGLLANAARSLDTDMPVTTALLFSGLQIFRALDAAPNEGAEARSRFAALTLLLTAAITLKLSAVVIAFALFLGAAWAYRGVLTSGRYLLRAWAAPAVLLLAWAARGVVLSGYPLYPSTAFGFPVEWRLDARQARAEAAWIRMSARTMDTNKIMVGFDWFGPWVKNLLLDVTYALSIALPIAVLAATGLIAAWRRRRAPHHRLTGWPVLAAAVAGAVFWFAVAPSPRFGPAPLWLAAAAAAGLAVASGGGAEPAARRLVTWGTRAAAAAIVGALILLPSRVAPSSGGALRRRSSSLGKLFTKPTGDRLPPVPPASVVGYRTASGLELVVPKDNNLCWRSSLLCTPHPEPNLALRVPGHLESGFVSIGGVWKPIRWPNPWTPFLPYLGCLEARGAGAAQACKSATERAVTDTLSTLATPPPAPGESR